MIQRLQKAFKIHALNINSLHLQLCIVSLQAVSLQRAKFHLQQMRHTRQHEKRTRFNAVLPQRVLCLRYNRMRFYRRECYVSFYRM